MIWLIETDVFRHDYQRTMPAALQACGVHYLKWEDAWWTTGLPALEGPVVFHGSLGNAARLASGAETPQPWAFCDIEAFHCSSWYPRAAPWLIHRAWRQLPADQLVQERSRVAEELGGGTALFVRPDSPLKPFSGRVVEVDKLTLAALDHGIYFDDETLPVLAAPVQDVGREWRFVVVNHTVVAGSEYVADGRERVDGAVEDHVARFAAQIAAEFPPPQPVYVLDICEVAGRLRIAELNPFSGADLYGCDLVAVIRAVEASLAG